VDPVDPSLLPGSGVVGQREWHQQAVFPHSVTKAGVGNALHQDLDAQYALVEQVTAGVIVGAGSAGIAFYFEQFGQRGFSCCGCTGAMCRFGVSGWVSVTACQVGVFSLVVGC
jgi:hypothetical protein